MLAGVALGTRLLCCVGKLRRMTLSRKRYGSDERQPPNPTQSLDWLQKRQLFDSMRTTDLQLELELQPAQEFPQLLAIHGWYVPAGLPSRTTLPNPYPSNIQHACEAVHLSTHD